jgi:cytochrome c oxidase subunit 3
MASISIDKNNKNGFIHPFKVILYISMASILMFFAITTSALLVKKGDVVSWEQFKLPSIFYISTVILIVSSALMHYSKNLYKEAKFSASKIFMVLSIIVSLLFIYTQYLGFNTLNEIGMPLTGNASGSFVYVIVGSHALHIIGGLVFSFIILAKSFIKKDDFQTKTINAKRLLSLELLTIYWHFIDFIWIYLFIFFYFNYQ